MNFFTCSAKQERTWVTRRGRWGRGPGGNHERATERAHVPVLTHSSSVRCRATSACVHSLLDQWPREPHQTSRGTRATSPTAPLGWASPTHNRLAAQHVAHDLERLLHLLLRGEVEHGAADDLIPRVPATQQRETRRVPTARNKRLQQREITGFEQPNKTASPVVRFDMEGLRHCCSGGGG